MLVPVTKCDLKCRMVNAALPTCCVVVQERRSAMGKGRHRLARLHALARAVVPLWENSRTARVGFHARRAAVVLLRVGF